MTISKQLIHQLHTTNKQQNAPADEKTMEETRKGFFI
jgi:hypothetical protein